MHHFFVAPEQISGEEIYIEGSDVNHMKNVLRMHPGEQAEISDGNNRKYLCTVREYRGDRAYLSIQESRMADTELESKLYLFQSLPKSDKMDYIVQKAGELGAYEVIPVVTKRCVVKLDAGKAQKKTARWNTIAESAAKQAGRSQVPRVAQVVRFDQALAAAAKMDVVLIPYELAEGMENTRKIIRSVKRGQSVGIFIGPEGGFEKAEVEEAVLSGARPVTLGRRILRTETAGLALLSVLMFELESPL